MVTYACVFGLLLLLTFAGFVNDLNAEIVGVEWDRGSEDAKAGTCDRSRHSDAYEEGWQACDTD